MNFVWILVPMLLSVFIGTQYVPTAEELNALFQQAQKFYATGAYDQAIEEYEKIVGSKSQLLDMASVTAEIGKIEAPLQEIALYQIGNSYLKTAEELQRRADQAGDRGKRSEYAQQADAQFDQAITFFLRTEEESATPALKSQARSQAISCWYKRKDYPRVIEESQRLMERYPDSPYVLQAMYDIGWSYYESEQYAESIRAFEALVERFPTGYRSDRAIFQIGESYYRLEQYDQAITFYRKLVDRQQIGRMSQMDILRMKREKIAGLVDETALDLVAKAQVRIGVCSARLGRYEEAAYAYGQVIKLFAEDPTLAFDAYVKLSDMYYDSGDVEASIRVYQQAIDTVPDKLFRAKMQFLIAARYYDAGDFGKAIEQYRVYREGYGDAAVHTSFSPDAAVYNTGRAFYELAKRASAQGNRAAARENYLQAVATYQDLLKAYPASPLAVAAQFNVALCYQMMSAPQEQMGELDGEWVDMDRALASYQAILEEHPKDSYAESALFQIARIYYGRKAYDQAEAVYQRILSTYPDSPQRGMAYFELGVNYRDAEAWKKAVEAFLNVTQDSELFSNARLVAAQILMERGENDRALEILREGLAATRSEEDQVQYPYLMGKVFAAKESYEQAIKQFTRVVEFGQGALTESALYGRGTGYLMLGRYPEAEGDFQRLLSSEDRTIADAAQKMLGLIHIRQGKTTEAVGVYRSLMEKTEDPSKKAGYLLLLAEFYDSLGEYDKVEEMARTLLALGVGDEKAEDQPYYLGEKAYFLLGTVYNRRNDYPSVIATYQEALARYPDSYYSQDMRFGLGVAYFQREDYEAAIPTFQTFLRGPKTLNTVYGLYYLGYAFFGQTMFEQSAETFSRLTKEFPNSDVAADALYRAGESNFNLRRFETAVSFYQRVVEDFPNSDQADDALYNLAWAFLEMEQGEKALDSFRQLATRFPHSEFSPSALFTVGDYYYNEQDYTSALEAYQEVVRRYPDSEVARKVPPLLKELNEIVAYLAYEKALAPFRKALSENDLAKYREAIGLFDQVIQQYPETESVIGALSNMGICYENLKEWKEAVAVYDQVLSSYTIEGGTPLPDAYRFAKTHRDWIVANRL